MTKINPEIESVGDPVVFTTKVEKEALWHLISRELMAHRIVYEAEGLFDPGSSLSIENRILRDKALQLSTDLGRQLSPIEALYLGLTSRIPEQTLEEWAKTTSYPRNEETFSSIARYLYQEKIDKDSS